MTEYISREKILDIVSQYCPDDDGSCSKADVDLREMLDEIEALPAADVQPVKCGQWENECYDEGLQCYIATCSECGYESTDRFRITDNHRRCEYCGARMIKNSNAE